MSCLVLKLLLISVVFSDPGEGLSNVAPRSSLIGPDALLRRLDRLLDVCIGNYEDLTTDLLLGVAIANGQLKSIPTGSSIATQPMIEMVRKKCDYVESRIDSIFSFPSSANALVSKLLINSNLWQSNDNMEDDYQSFIDSKSAKNQQDGFENLAQASADAQKQSNGRHTLHSYLRALQLGTPNEHQSDECLSELLVNESENEFDMTQSPTGEWQTQLKPLLLSHECSNAMSLRNKSYGYHLTHKLLFYLVLGKQHFSNIQHEFVMTATDQLCDEILRESQLIAELDYPAVFRDLFMEQVFLCAYLGYAEFHNQTWLSEIVHWQNGKGCFQYFRDANRVGTNRLTKHCSTHMTGVGAAVLGLFAKLQLVE